jgi:hypothetical protein
MLPTNQPYYKWPRQPCPAQPSWRIWRKAIKAVFLCNIRLHLSPEMYLGRWIDNNSTGWYWFYSRQERAIYEKPPNRWRVHRRQGRGRMGELPIFRYTSDAFSKPTQTLRCTVIQDARGRLHLQGSGRDGEELPREILPSQTILNNNAITGELGNILQAIRDGTAKAVSDGSYLSTAGIGTAGWIIEGDGKGNQLQGQHKTPGTEEI